MLYEMGPLSTGFCAVNRELRIFNNAGSRCCAFAARERS